MPAFSNFAKQFTTGNDDSSYYLNETLPSDDSHLIIDTDIEEQDPGSEN
jgi:hypothetical protein